MDISDDTTNIVTPTGEAMTCPECHKKLLTRSSIMCNWCGAKIKDLDYLQRAAEARQTADEATRKSLEAAKVEPDKYGSLRAIFGRKKETKKGEELHP